MPDRTAAQIKQKVGFAWQWADNLLELDQDPAMILERLLVLLSDIIDAGWKEAAEF